MDRMRHLVDENEGDTDIYGFNYGSRRQVALRWKKKKETGNGQHHRPLAVATSTCKALTSKHNTKFGISTKHSNLRKPRRSPDVPEHRK